MSNPLEKERPTVLIMYSLAVTLASMWQMGIGRVVIVGRTRETPELMTAAFTIVEHLIETGKETVPMEMAYWVRNEFWIEGFVFLGLLDRSLTVSNLQCFNFFLSSTSFLGFTLS